MAGGLPEKKPVAALLEHPQMIAIEIKIDRVDLIIQSLNDVEDIVLWVQVLDLPCMEMLPYQRGRLTSGSIETFSSSTINFDRSIDPSSTSHTVKIAKKSSGLVVGEPDTNNSKTDVLPERHRAPMRVKRKSKDKNKKFRLKETDRCHSEAKAHEVVKPVGEVTETEHGETPTPAALDRRVSVEVLKDIDSLKKIKLLSKFLASVPDEVPMGAAFNSDCCVLIPCSSVANVLFKMETMPIMIYLVQANASCPTLIGKVSVPLDYSFQEAVVKAAKMKGGVATHGVQNSFPIYRRNRADTLQLKVGYLFGSVKLICYGRFGMTELKSPSGDLMTGRLREWKTELRDTSQGLGGEGVVDEQPYGFTPVVTRDTLPPVNDRQCPSSTPVRSMFDLIENFYNPDQGN